jgi:hypothetical protein
LVDNFGYNFDRAFVATALQLTATQSGGVPQAAENFTQFVQAAFGPQATGTGPVCAPNQDPDGDGMCNLLEFAFGTDPNDRASCAKPKVGLVTVDGHDYVTIRYARSKSAAGVLTSVEFSTDLVNWRANSDTERVTQTISVTPSAENADCEIIVEAAVVPMSATKPAFLRVRVSLQQP